MKLCLAACASFVLSIATVASAQSLADVAKKAEEERAKAETGKKEPTKVITNDDLKKDGAASDKKGDEGAATAKKTAASKNDTEKTDAKNEASWRRRATELHARLTADEKAAAAEREKLNRLQHTLEELGCVACRERNQLESQLNQQKEQQARLDSKVAADRTAIQAFEEEGRRAGILPGWLRPQD